MIRKIPYFAMTKDEYLKIVQKSKIFQSMKADLQEKILQATETAMPQYLKILQEGDETLTTAKKEFLQKNKEIVKSFSADVKKIKTSKLKRDEKKAMDEDEKIGNQWLEQLNQI